MRKKFYSLIVLGTYLFSLLSVGIFLDFVKLVSATGSSGLNEAPIITSPNYFLVADGGINIGTVTATDQDNIVIQYGTKNVTGNNWSATSHAEMCNPVVVSSSRNDVDAEVQRVVRVKDKSSNSFDVKVDNQGSSIPNGSLNQVDWVVTSAGSQNLVDDSSNSLQIQAGSVLTSSIFGNSCKINSSSSVVNFTPIFTSTPTMIHSISSNNDTSSTASMVNGDNGNRNSEPTSAKFSTFLQRGFGVCVHAPETVDYIASDQGHYIFGGDEIDTVKSTDTIRSVTPAGNPVTFTSAFSSIPQTILVSQLGEDGGNGAYANVHTGGAPTTLTFPATIDEDGNTNRAHTLEPVGAFAFEKSSGVIAQKNILSYSIFGGNNASDFSIDPSSGVVTSTTNLSTGTYNLDVQVCDSHCNSKCITQSISVEIDTLAPIISATNFGNNDILPGGNHEILINYFDNNSGINTASANIELKKWDGISAYGGNISTSNISQNSITTNFVSYDMNNLEYGKYQYIFSISDVAGNIQTQTLEFYIDEPEFMISDELFDIGDINSSTEKYSDIITLTVKTVGAGFTLQAHTPIPSLIYSGENISSWNGNNGFGFSLAPYTSISRIGVNQEIVNQNKSVNINGQKNIYTFNVKLGAVAEILQAGGEYIGNIDFSINFNY